jgi:hypothetical protein
MKRTLFLAGSLLFAVLVADGQKNLTVEKKQLKVTKAEKTEFREFLRNKRSGIIKLLNNPCSNEIVVDAADEKCAGRSDVIFGSNYSFFAKVYFEKYQHVNYASVSFTQSELVVKNNTRLVQLLVDLGERSIREIDKQSEDVINLSSFPLFDKIEREKFSNTGDGYEFRGLKITNRQKAGLNRTFLLRSVFDTGFRSLTGGKRETIFAFQIVRQKDELITVLWKELYSRDI